MQTLIVIGVATAIVAPGSISKADDCDPPCPPGAILEGESCGMEINRGCFGEAEGGSNCCVVHGFPSCDNPRCNELICAVDSFRRSVAWDQVCVDEALKVCPELCGGQFPQLWSPIAVGQVVCGSLSTNSAGSDDVDWYEFHLDAQTEVTVTLSGGPPMQLGIVDDDGIPDCAFALEWEPFTTVAHCASAAVTACLEAGTHWIVVQPDASRGLECDSPGTHYVLEVSSSSRRCALPDPVNDTCATALPIGLGVTTISTHNAATENSRYVTCGGFETEMFRDVWFELVAPRTGRLRLSACNDLNFFYDMTAYSGTCAGLVPASCTDAGNLCPLNGPQIDVDVTAGDSIFVRVGSHLDEDGGSIALTISYLPCSPAYELELIQPGHLDGVAQDISPDGKIVGKRLPSFGDPRGFRWSEMSGYQEVSPSKSELFDVNSSGLAVGWLKPGATTLPGSTTGFMLTAFPPFMGCSTGQARAVNESGVVVGYFDCGSLPVRWIDGAAQLLPVPPGANQPIDINEAGDILGEGSSMAWLLVGERFQWIPSPEPRAIIKARALNNVGQVVGLLEFDNGDPVGFVWNAGKFTMIDAPAPYTTSTANDISDTGAIVGDLSKGPLGRSTYLKKGDIIVDLNTRIDSRSPLGFRRAEALNEAGVIVGSADIIQPAVRLKPNPPTGDLDCNAIVDAADLAELLGLWGLCAENTSCAPDFNVDGVVDAADLAILLGGWGSVR